MNEDIATSIRPMLLQLGARHRVYYKIGKSEMLLIFNPIMETVKEMLGRSRWAQDDTADSWAYVIAIIMQFMMVGWDCGEPVLGKSLGDSSGQFEHVHVTNSKALRDFRDASREDFGKFFSLFAKETK